MVTEIKTPQVHFTIVRHGQSTGNARQAWEGSGTDSELSDLGRRQAHATGEYLLESLGQVKTIYSSPLRRAIQTADAIAASIKTPVEPLDGLKELDMGDLDGKTSEEILAEYPDIVSLWGPEASTPFPGGESSLSVAERGIAAFQEIAQRHQTEDRIIVVSHQALITLTLSSLLNDRASFMEYQTSNCSVTSLVFGVEPELVSFNYVDHLVEAGLDTGKVLPEG